MGVQIRRVYADAVVYCYELHRNKEHKPDLECMSVPLNPLRNTQILETHE